MQELVDHLKQQAATSTALTAATTRTEGPSEGGCGSGGGGAAAAAGAGAGAGTAGGAVDASCLAVVSLPPASVTPQVSTVDGGTQTEVEGGSPPRLVAAASPPQAPHGASHPGATGPSEADPDLTALRGQVADLQATVAFYTTLTGLEVTRVQASAQGPMFFMAAGPTTFSLGPCVDGEPEELEFAPRAGCSTLPEFLQVGGHGCVCARVAGLPRPPGFHRGPCLPCTLSPPPIPPGVHRIRQGPGSTVPLQGH
jgi:hypothetical protein